MSRNNSFIFSSDISDWMNNPAETKRRKSRERYHLKKELKTEKPKTLSRLQLMNEQLRGR